MLGIYRITDFRRLIYCLLHDTRFGVVRRMVEILEAQNIISVEYFSGRNSVNILEGFNAVLPQR
jgi:hypothetical protein